MKSKVEKTRGSGTKVFKMRGSGLSNFSLSAKDIRYLETNADKESGKYENIINGKVVNRYAKFGRYYIYRPNIDHGILDIRYCSGNNITGIPKTPISADFMSILKSAAESQTDEFNLDQYTYNDLDDSEKTLLQLVLKKCCVLHNLKFNVEAPINSGKERTEDVTRFNILRGELVAGNNSPEILKELKVLTIKFLKKSTIGRNDAYELLCLLALN